jgi:hypothetical protein
MTDNRTPVFERPQLSELADIFATTIVRQMTPLEIGRLLHPDAEAVPYKNVPIAVLADHKTRYSRAELRRGQFFKIGEKYTFIMDHDTYDRRNRTLD